MDKGFTEIFLNLFEFQSRLIKLNTDSEKVSFVLEWLDCIAFQKRGVNDFADLVMDRMIEYREKSAQRQKEYRERKKNSESASEEITEAAESTAAEEPAKQPPRNKRKKTDDSDNPDKKPYGEAQNVYLTDKEYNSLLKRNGVNIDRVIEKISSYKASNGKVYSSDYSAIINWVENEVRQEIAKADAGKTFQQRDREDAARRAREAFPEVMEMFGL